MTYNKIKRLLNIFWIRAIRKSEIHKREHRITLPYPQIEPILILPTEHQCGWAIWWGDSLIDLFEDGSIHLTQQKKR